MVRGEWEGTPRSSIQGVGLPPVALCRVFSWMWRVLSQGVQLLLETDPEQGGVAP